MEEEGGGCLGALFFIGVAIFCINSQLQHDGKTWEDLLAAGLTLFLYLLIGIAVFVGILAAIAALLGIIATYPKETLMLVSVPIWLPHLLVAGLWIALIRSRPVRRALLENNAMRRAIYGWLAVIPALVGFLWFAMVTHTIQAPFLIDEFAALISTGLLLGFYYLIYFKYPPKSPDWLMFAATETMLTFELRAQAIRRLTKWKAEYAANKGTIQAAFITLCISLLVVLVATSIT